MKPLDRAVFIVACYHLAERNTAADAVQRLIRINFDIEIRHIGGFLLTAASNFRACIVAAKLVQTLLELWVGGKLLLEAPQIQIKLPNAIVYHVVCLDRQAHLFIAPRHALRVQAAQCKSN